MNKNIHFSLITLVICLFFHTTIHASEYDIDPLENQLTTSGVELDSEFPADIIPPSYVIPDLPDDENEKNVLSTRGWRYEGIAWTVEQ